MAHRPVDYVIPIKITKRRPSRGLSIRPTSVRKLASSNNSKRSSINELVN